MSSSSTFDGADPGVDPFLERTSTCFTAQRQVLGGRFCFSSNSQALLGLVDAAYGGLPEHSLAVSSPELLVELRLSARNAPGPPSAPPPVVMQSGAGLICGVMDASNYVVLAPERRQALVVVSSDMLHSPYHVRYELIEFAVFVLATRALRLVPLHGACVGRQGRGVLLLGESGSGKSTLALHSLLQGLDFLAEDAVFVQPDGLVATGVANFLHLQCDAVRFVESPAVRRWITQAPVIRRRSGVEKFEADLRQAQGAIAAAPLALTSVVFVCAQPAVGADALLTPLSKDRLAARLAEDQPYAATQPGWRHFEEAIMERGGYELRRPGHPRAAVDALQALL